MARLLVLSPGFPTAEHPHYTPAIVDTLSTIARTHALTVCALRPPPEHAGWYTHRGLRIIASGRRSRGMRASIVLLSLKGGPVDVVWSLWGDRTGALAAFVSRLIRRPLVVSLMGGELSDLPELDYGYLRKAGSRRILERILRRAAVVTVGSRPMLERAQRIFAASIARKFVVAPIGVPSELVAVRGASKEGSLRIAIVSDLSPVKRVGLAIAAVAVLVRRGVRLHVDVFGSSSHAEGVRFQRELIDHDLQLTFDHHGFIAPDRLRMTLASHDVLLHTSAHESQGVALIEAALANVAIVSTRVGVAEELRACGARIRISDPATPDSIADAIEFSINTPGEARARVSATFDLEPCAARFSRILQEAASR